MKVKIKKKGEDKKFLIIDADYFSVTDNEIHILWSNNMVLQIIKDLHGFLGYNLDYGEEEKYTRISSPSEYIHIERFSIFISKESDDDFSLEIYVDNELILS